jgi:glycosyltransferase involved in cell wall biosynthesis
MSPMRERVVFRGFGKDVWSAYAALDIVCVPSTEPESFGLVAVEAMAMAKPVLASRMGGLTEIVIHGATGLMFDPCCARSLAAALGELLGDDEGCKRMGRTGLARFDAEFCALPMIERFVATYIETIGQTK